MIFGQLPDLTDYLFYGFILLHQREEFFPAFALAANMMQPVAHVRERSVYVDYYVFALLSHAFILVACGVPAGTLSPVRNLDTFSLNCMILARRFIVRGHVQGVGFRYFAVRAARRAGVTGTVRNLPEGSVEAIAEGTMSALAGFCAELERGPDYGHVASVDVYEIAPTGRYTGFDVVY
jgi:acylphosphatase